MDRSFFNHRIPDADSVLEYLSRRQHLAPHETVQNVLHDAGEICPGAIAQAVSWLKLDTRRAIGRLRRTELTQLARSIHRFWENSSRAASSL